MHKRFFKSKIFKIVTCIVIALILVYTIGGGNYLVTFALKSSYSTGDVEPASTVGDSNKEIIKANKEEIKARTAEWMESEAGNFNDIYVMTDDGLKLEGEVYLAKEKTDKWVIAVHGYREEAKNVYNLGYFYAQQGYNVLYPNLRGCGPSQGKYIGMGWLDKKDMLKWIDCILDTDPDAQIVLHGISMGGATVMMTSGEELPANVKAIVEDCGYTTVWDIFSDELDYLFGLPDFPILYCASVFSKIRAGYGFKEASSIDMLKKCDTPMLFIHGSEDNFVRSGMVDVNFDACSAPKEKLVVEGAGHGNSYLRDPDLYFKTVFDFLGKYVK